MVDIAGGPGAADQSFGSSSSTAELMQEVGRVRSGLDRGRTPAHDPRDVETLAPADSSPALGAAMSARVRSILLPRDPHQALTARTRMTRVRDRSETEPRANERL